jgi:hypothetical protein
MTEFVEWLNTESEISPVLIAGISQYQSDTPIHFWMTMAEQPEYSARLFFTRTVTISSDYSYCPNITIRIALIITTRFNP